MRTRNRILERSGRRLTRSTRAFSLSMLPFTVVKWAFSPMDDSQRPRSNRLTPTTPSEPTTRLSFGPAPVIGVQSNPVVACADVGNTTAKRARPTARRLADCLTLENVRFAVQDKTTARLA